MTDLSLYLMPAEWVRHRRTWLAWPFPSPSWDDAETLAGAKRAYAETALAIAESEPLFLLVREEDRAESESFLGDKVRYIPAMLSDSWVRDSGPTFLIAKDQSQTPRHLGISWKFNAWGEKYPDHAADAALADHILQTAGIPAVAAPCVMEGGAIHVDGQGTLLTTESVMLNPNRNGPVDRQTAEQWLCQFTGSRKVIWLGEGLEGDEEPVGTDGHVDTLACFVRPGVVLALDCDDPADANYPVLKENIRRLKAERDVHGREIEVIPLKQPAPQTWRGNRLPLSYINFYISNKAIILPTFADPLDEAARETLQRLFPDRAVKAVDGVALFRGGGGPHCITQQEPE